MHCGKGVADRQVFLTKDGSQTDLIQSIISTEFYKNFSKAQSRFIGIYDTKNARLRAVQREPVLSEADFRKLCGVMDAIMKRGDDICWLVCGAHDEAEPQIIAHIDSLG